MTALHTLGILSTSYFYLTFIELGKSVKNKFLFTLTANQKAKGLLSGWGPRIKNKIKKYNINIERNIHDKIRDNTTLDSDLRQQGSNT